MVHGNPRGGRIAAGIAIGVLWLLTTWAAAASGKAAEESLRALAIGARATLAQRLEPPIAQLPFLCTVGRTQGSPIRQVLLRQQAQAIDALVSSATTPADVKRVRQQLQRLQRFGSSRDAEAWLVERLSGTTGLLLAASLGELPAALHERIHPGCRGVASYVGAVGRTGLPLGRLARPDYERIAEEDPSNPWHAIVLAWVSGMEGEAAIRSSLMMARGSSSPEARRVELFAWQQWAWLLEQQGRDAEAQAAALEAVRLAQAAVGESERVRPDTAQAYIDDAYTRIAMARVLDDAGSPALAFDLLQTSEPVLRRLADARYDDLPVQIAFIDALGHMATAQNAAGRSPGGDPRYLREAWARYEALQSRTPYDRMGTTAGLPGTFIFAAVMAGILTLVTGSVLLWRYRLRVAALMNLTARTRADSSSPVVPRASAARKRPSGAAGAIGPAKRAQRRAAAVQIIAGIAFGLLACMLHLHADALEPNVNRVAMMTWTWAWPTVLALGFVWDGDRRRKRLVWAAYFAGLLLLCTLIALGDTPPLQSFGMTVPPFFQGLLYWANSLSFTPFLLLFLNRTVRSIGPALLALMLVATAGGMLLLEGASTPAGTRVAASALSALHLPMEWMLPTVMLVGMLAFVPLAWAVGRMLRAAYAARWTSDQSLMIDAVWLFQAALLSLSLSWSMGAPALGFGLAAFALHKILTLAGMWPVARAARRRAPARLLLLRVFSRRDAKGRRRSRRSNAERLFDLLSARWRYAGPIHLIGAPDLASTALNPHSFLDFLAGRLRQRFIIEPAEVPTRMAVLDERCDLDARWRVNELFCGNDAWRPAVLALMNRSDLVAMDLRDFRPDNDGCVFELHALLDIVPASRIALLVDRTTDRAFLERTITVHLHAAGRAPTERWTDASASLGMAFVDIDKGGERVAVDALLQHTAQLDDASPGAVEAAPEAGGLPRAT